jgi:radical SAM protein with 4Fe4S-binding SPASM domain
MDYHCIPQISYDEFSEQIHGKIIKQRHPLDGTFELTFRCNLNCSHCYCNLSPKDKASQARELTTKEVFRILDEIANQGCLWLLFTGGEPLLRKDFIDIYAYAKRKGILVTLFTNGTLITDEIADCLQDFPPFLVEITLYGATRETYEKITGVPGSFPRCINGIDLLVKRKIPLRLKTTMMTTNYPEFEAMRNFAQSRGVKFRFDQLVHPRLDGAFNPCKVRLSPEEAVSLDLSDESRLTEFKKSYREFTFSSSVNNNLLYYCGAGENFFSINPYGRLQLCPMLTRPSFDLHKGTFRQGWRDFLPQFKSLPKKEKSQCDDCRNQPLCGRCPAWAALESNNPPAPIQYLCEIAYLREEAFGLKTQH